MQPSPPKALRTRKTLNRPFYEIHTKSSAEIVSEARSLIRPLDTKRPFTPLDLLPRMLIPDASYKIDRRPPSGSSFGSFSCDSRPPTGKKLSPIKDEIEFMKQQNSILPKKDVPKIDQDVLKLEIQHTSLPPLKARPELKHSSFSEPLINIPSHLTKETNDYVKTWLKRCSSSEDMFKNKDLHKKIDRKRLCFEENVRPLLKQMELNHLHEDSDALLTNFDILWKTLEFEDMLGKNKLDTKQRSEILSSVMKCSNYNIPLILLKLTKLFLALEVSGKNLEVVSKILFRLAQERNNDLLFVKEKMLDPILKVLMMAEKLDHLKCLVYLCGTLKLLSGNLLLFPDLVKCNILDVLVYVLNVTEKFQDIQAKDGSHALIQVVSTLANLANDDSLHDKFLMCRIPQLLLQIVDIHKQDEGIVLSYCRVMSKLTVSEKSCLQLCEDSFYKIQVHLLKKYILNKDIAVRLCFIIGNLATFLPECLRIFTFHTECLDLVVSINATYMEKCEANFVNSDPSKEDVVIKAVRVIANLSMNEECAQAFSDNKTCISTFISILDSQHTSLELRNNVIATVNNLAFFATKDCYFSKMRNCFTKAMIKMLFSGEMKSILEVLRALGNFTQHKVVRDALIKTSFGKLVSELLNSSNHEVLFSVCGVLVNMMVDKDKRFVLRNQNIISKLIDLLRNLSERDWCLAALICQILCNYTDELTSVEACFNQEESDDVITILKEFLDPVLALDYDYDSDLDEDTINWLKHTWYENFHPVAEVLLQRFDNISSNLVAISAAPD